MSTCILQQVLKRCHLLLHTPNIITITILNMAAQYGNTISENDIYHKLSIVGTY